MKSLDAKLNDIHSNPSSSKSFIIADAKDADMAFGIKATGPRGYLAGSGEIPAHFSPEIWTREEFGYRNLPEYLEIIREIIAQRTIDIMLMSASVNERLTIQEGLFRNSPITPAARANDTSDVWAIRHGNYLREPAQPFRSASIDAIQCGQVECNRSPGANDFPGANLGLYSVTFLNELEQDRKTLLAFKEFREEAERKKFRYFLEVFDPNVDSGIPPEKLGEFINDNIIRTLAGVTDAGRPIFLKIVYHGPRLMEELVQYDPHLIVGILGGSAGTTHDAFKLIHDAQKHGARVALFGRKINNAEHQLAFIEILRLITDHLISPEEAVRAYHGILQAKGIRPRRSLQEDLLITEPSLIQADPRKKTISISPSTSVPVHAVYADRPILASSPVPATPASEAAIQKSDLTTESVKPDTHPGLCSPLWPVKPDLSPDFSRMTSDQRLSYNLWRLNKKFR